MLIVLILRVAVQGRVMQLEQQRQEAERNHLFRVLQEVQIRAGNLMPGLLSCLGVPSLVLFGYAFILSNSSNRISNITPKDPYRFIQVFPAVKH